MTIQPETLIRAEVHRMIRMDTRSRQTDERTNRRTGRRTNIMAIARRVYPIISRTRMQQE